VASASTRCRGAQGSPRPRSTGTGRPEALLLESRVRLGPKPPAPDTGSPIGDLQALASHLAAEFQSARWAAWFSRQAFDQQFVGAVVNAAVTRHVTT